MSQTGIEVDTDRTRPRYRGYCNACHWKGVYRASFELAAIDNSRHRRECREAGPRCPVCAEPVPAGTIHVCDTSASKKDGAKVRKPLTL